MIKSDGVDINARDNEGKTPLMWAAQNGEEDAVRLLIKRDGVDIGATDNEGETALSLAVEGVKTCPGWKRRKYRAIVRLLNARCDVRAGGSHAAPAGSLTEDVQSRS